MAKAAIARQSQQELAEQFKGLAAQITESSRTAFLEEFSQLTKGHTEVAEKQVKDLLNPVREDLDKLNRQVGQAEDARESLAKETRQLRNVLGDSRMRGSWGEQQLRKVIELAGLTERVSYVKQATIAAESDQRPDVIVHLPENLDIVIDAKAPLEAYRRAVDAEDEEEQRTQLNKHANALRLHAAQLGKKNYTRELPNAPEFVIMYVPTDSMLDAAMKANAGSWEAAWHEHRVLITSPGLLIALLNSVAFAWKRQEMEKNAKHIAELGERLYERLRTHAKELGSIGAGLNTAVKSYNKSIGSLENRVLVTARNLRALNAADAKPGPKPLPPVTAAVRPIVKAELQESEDPID
ncbi:DNA recombination protein RmuC [Candidatus Poriferisodalis sp.]|uniref:DNA recombination protein RmuC n=1 Tax=Candidatus Poriferisodalis sp. TaxID=3101277 RepID=UPI003B01AA43